MSDLSRLADDFAVEIACLQEKNNFLAVRQGMPAIGSVLKNAHGIEWLVDGHTSAPSLLRSSEDNQGELYPAIIPQNLSKRMTEFVAEVNRCTPKVLVPLDTMPLMFPKRGHPAGHWVDAWSDPYRILLFLDAANIHETVLAHEIAHVWIDLVRNIEDYRVLEDRSNPARYSHVQFIQSFVLDVPVNRVLEEKGFDVEVIQRDAGLALQNLAEAMKRGYRPPSKREAAFLGSFLASAILGADEKQPGIVRFQDNLLAVRPHLPEIYKLGEQLARVITDSPPDSKENVQVAVDEALAASFAFCEERLDIEKELIEIAPEVAWDEDKHPEWLAGQSVPAKCEIGITMARLKADSMAVPELSYSPTSKVRIRFEFDDGGFTEYVELDHVKSVPGVLHPHVKSAIEHCERNRRRIEEMTNQPKQGPSHHANQPSLRSPFPPFPGHRTYSTGLAQWITRVRLEELLSGEHPYSYAQNNPVTYTDPTGEWVMKPLPCKGIKGKIITVHPGDTTGVVGAVASGGTVPLTGGGDCTKGFKDAQGRDCVCVNGSFFDFRSGIPAGTYKDCQGQNVIGDNPYPQLPVVTGHGSLKGFPPIEAPKHANTSPTGRTAACTGPHGGLLFLAVVDESNGVGLGSFSNCMKSICKSPNKVVILDGSGSSQIWHNGKPIYPGDNRRVVNWLVICK